MIETDRSGVTDRWWKEDQGMESSIVDATNGLHWLAMVCSVRMTMALVLEGG